MTGQESFSQIFLEKCPLIFLISVFHTFFKFSLLVSAPVKYLLWKRSVEVIDLTTYIIRRLLLLSLILFGISLIVFGMIQSLGPDRLLAAYVNPGVLDKLTPIQLEKIKQKYGLNDPMMIRYLKWLKNTVHGTRRSWLVIGGQAACQGRNTE